jgi:signal transduction histidine kinase
MTGFTVDTQLFRELGELLVGRDSTALIELIKNAYDADAEEVVVYGERLSDGDAGSIVVQDTGNGMTDSQFSSGFLRVASRAKQTDDRRSPVLRRRYTGEKGIGRLAAHKLARAVRISSVPRTDMAASASQSPQALDARIDWDLVERYETLDQVGGDAVWVQTGPAPPTASHGTTLRLSPLRRAWTERQLTDFVAEVQAFEPPALLVNPLPRYLTDEPLLFGSLNARDAGLPAPFRVTLEGDFSVGEALWKELAQSMSWIVEVRAAREGVRVVTAPTKLGAKREGAGRAEGLMPHPDPEAGPFFEARVLVHEGQRRGTQRQRSFTRIASGIRVYLEGFRVAPYGEPGNDWLDLDRAYSERSYGLTLAGSGLETSLGEVDREALTVLRNTSYFGAVLLKEVDAPGLRTLVNREGFVPDASFDTLRKLIRLGIDLNTRARARVVADRRPQRDAQRATRKAAKRAAFESDRELVEEVREATEQVKAIREMVATVRQPEMDRAVDQLVARLSTVAALGDEAISERALLRILASVGTQMAAFVHEITGLVAMAQSVETALGRLADELPEAAPRLRPLLSTVQDLRRRVDRQASYLADVVTIDARRRRRRLSIHERFEAARRLVEPTAERRAITIENEIPEDIRSPPMFDAELTTILSNLLTNAVKAAGADGRVAASADRAKDGTVSILLRNTGTPVEGVDRERWFQPFESTTIEELDPVLGQGMGLGLPITRSMLQDYRGEIAFVDPDPGWAAQVEVRLPS